MAEKPKGRAAASGRRQRVESVEPEEPSREISRLERLIEGVRAECVELRFEVGEEGRFAVRGIISLSLSGARCPTVAAIACNVNHAFIVGVGVTV
jgi:hypothetical protein